MKHVLTALLFTSVCSAAVAQHSDPAKGRSKEIFRFVEQSPKPAYDMNVYLEKQLVYPKEARDAKVQGQVVVTFVVNDDGSISDVEVVKGKELGHGLPEEAQRVIMSLPRWTPGRQNGQNVNVYFTLPITFSLQ